MKIYITEEKGSITLEYEDSQGNEYWAGSYEVVDNMISVDFIKDLKEVLKEIEVK